MRCDWQSHCLVITVWWTSIVFRLVETEACWASARSTNANLFHVDIISHCLLSNHNTCLTFFFFFLHNENVLPGSLFYFGSEAGSREARGHGRDHPCDAQRFIHLTWLLSDVVKCQERINKKKDGEHKGGSCGDSPIKVILSERYCECDLICQTESPTVENITSHAPWETNWEHRKGD